MAGLVRRIFFQTVEKEPLPNHAVILLVAIIVIEESSDSPLQ
jgi:hypothetical protein